ncbi:hypothetical protein [Streptomyces beigongshangae]|uniref:hypothetical protein n=1 Tax=Streptomyces beigongshangae TaxID=2841597 RepID=UPI001C84CDCB|nr:hypothetical protein [Streptomyces sp. REN17]
MVSRKTFWATAAGLAGAVAVARRARTDEPAPDPVNRWLTVTVNRAPGDVQADKLPAPLQEYGERIETRIVPAPGDRGTELAVRFREAPSAAEQSVTARITGNDPRQDLRVALREAKSLLETGEVMRPDEPTAHPTTPGGKLVGLLSRRAGGEGVL